METACYIYMNKFCAYFKSWNGYCKVLFLLDDISDDISPYFYHRVKFEARTNSVTVSRPWLLVKDEEYARDIPMQNKTTK